jgi:hypothetical protein
MLDKAGWPLMVFPPPLPRNVISGSKRDVTETKTRSHVRVAPQEPDLLDPEIPIISLTQDLLLGGNRLDAFPLFVRLAFFMIVFRDKLGSPTETKRKVVNFLRLECAEVNMGWRSAYLSSRLKAWRKYRTYPMAEAKGKFGNLVIPKAETVSLFTFHHKCRMISLGTISNYVPDRNSNRHSPDPNKLDRDMHAPTKDPLVLFWRASILTGPARLFDLGILGRRAEGRVGERDIGRGGVDAPGTAA